MGLTKSSTATKVLESNIHELKKKCKYTIALAGNPNVGKSTVFNGLTGMHQHTGNWPGKTVSNAYGVCHYNNIDFLLVDIPGTYSIMSNSEEEEIARNFICFGEQDCTIVVVDATCLERNLNLVYQIMEITEHIVVCVNLLDEAKKKGISIDLEQLSNYLGVPVVGTIARKNNTLKHLMKAVYDVCSGKYVCQPKKIIYIPIIEEAISLIEPEFSKYSHILPARWLSLKLLDGNKKILTSIENHLNISFYQPNLKDLLLQAQDLLKNNGINASNFKDKIVSSIVFNAENICNDVVQFEKKSYQNRDRKIDKILTSKKYGIPIMILFWGIIFWLTIVGANYPSQILSNLFTIIEEKLLYAFEIFHAPNWFSNVVVLGMYRTLTWVIAVMLPPMAIFFPLFTILEDLGYLPRIAFNLDHFFQKACTTGKQALTMCMGFGCNAAGVVGCRIIDSPRERLIAIITNAFVPCNGRFPMLITVSLVFFGGLFGGFYSSIVATVVVLGIIIFGIYLTLVISKLLSHTLLKGLPSSFVLELPPYRKPQFGKIFIRSIFDRTLFVLGRAVSVAAPAGIVIWLLANITISDTTLLTYIATFFDPFAKLIGLDGYIITAFILGLPANEIVLPIVLMSYLSQGVLVDLEDISQIGNVLIQNGWTFLTAINFMIITLLHFPCATTLLTIKKETGSWKWTFASFIIPTLCGIVICFATTTIWNVFAL